MNTLRLWAVILLFSSFAPLSQASLAPSRPAEIGDIVYMESYYVGAKWGFLNGVWRPGHAAVFVGTLLGPDLSIIESNVETFSTKAIYQEKLVDFMRSYWEEDANDGSTQAYRRSPIENH